MGRTVRTLDGHEEDGSDAGWPTVRDLREWTELTRRLMRPFYEQARGYLSRAAKDGLWRKGLALYDAEMLEAHIEQYQPRSWE